jgi:NAD(P)H-dependent FMN reductase
MRLLGLSGSLRRDSYNRRLLLAAFELVPDGVETALLEGLEEVLPYSEDDDHGPVPAPVAALRAALAGATRSCSPRPSTTTLSPAS